MLQEEQHQLKQMILLSTASSQADDIATRAASGQADDIAARAAASQADDIATRAAASQADNIAAKAAAGQVDNAASNAVGGVVVKKKMVGNILKNIIPRAISSRVSTIAANTAVKGAANAIYKYSGAWIIVGLLKLIYSILASLSTKIAAKISEFLMKYFAFLGTGPIGILLAIFQIVSMSLDMADPGSTMNATFNTTLVSTSHSMKDGQLKSVICKPNQLLGEGEEQCDYDKWIKGNFDFNKFQKNVECKGCNLRDVGLDEKYINISDLSEESLNYRVKIEGRSTVDYDNCDTEKLCTENVELTDLDTKYNVKQKLCFGERVKQSCDGKEYALSNRDYWSNILNKIKQNENTIFEYRDDFVNKYKKFYNVENDFEFIIDNENAESNWDNFLNALVDPNSGRSNNLYKIEVRKEWKDDLKRKLGRYYELKEEIKTVLLGENSPIDWVKNYKYTNIVVLNMKEKEIGSKIHYFMQLKLHQQVIELSYVDKLKMKIHLKIKEVVH